jgi:hypothetical protein
MAKEFSIYDLFSPKDTKKETPLKGLSVPKPSKSEFSIDSLLTPKHVKPLFPIEAEASKKDFKEGLYSLYQFQETFRGATIGSPRSLMQGLLGTGKTITGALGVMRAKVEVPFSMKIYQVADYFKTISKKSRAKLKAQGVPEAMLGRNDQLMIDLYRKLYPSELIDKSVGEVWDFAQQKVLAGEIDQNKIFMYSMLSPQQQEKALIHHKYTKYPILIGAEAMSWVTHPLVALGAGLRTKVPKVDGIPLSGLGKKKFAEAAVRFWTKGKVSLGKKAGLIKEALKDFRTVPDYAKEKALRFITDASIKKPELLDPSVLRVYGIPVVKKGGTLWKAGAKGVEKISKKLWKTETVKRLVQSLKAVAKPVDRTVQIKAADAIETRIEFLSTMEARIRAADKWTSKGQSPPGAIPKGILDLAELGVKKEGKRLFLERIALRDYGIDLKTISSEARAILEKKVMIDTIIKDTKPYLRGLAPARDSAKRLLTELRKGVISSESREIFERRLKNLNTFLNDILPKDLPPLEYANRGKIEVYSRAVDEIISEYEHLGVYLSASDKAKLSGIISMAQDLFEQIPPEFRSLVRRFRASHRVLTTSLGRPAAGFASENSRIFIGDARFLSSNKGMFPLQTTCHELSHLIRNKYPLDRIKSAVFEEVGKDLGMHANEVFAIIGSNVLLNRMPGGKRYVLTDALSKHSKYGYCYRIVRDQIKTASNAGYKELAKVAIEDGMIPLKLTKEVPIKWTMEKIMRSVKADLKAQALKQGGEKIIPGGLAPTFEKAYSTIKGIAGEPDRTVLRYITPDGIQRTVSTETPFIAEGRAWKWVAENKWITEDLRVPTKLGTIIDSIKKGLGEAFVYNYDLSPAVRGLDDALRSRKQLHLNQELTQVKNFTTWYPVETDRIKIAQYINDLHAYRFQKLRKAPEIEPRLKKGAELFQGIMIEIENYEKQMGLVLDIPSFGEYITHFYKDAPKRSETILNAYWRKTYGLQKKSRLWQKRVLETWQEAEEAGLHPIKDAAKILGLRVHACNDLKGRIGFIEGIKKLPADDIMMLKEGQKVPDNFIKLDKIAPTFKGWAGTAKLGEFINRWFAAKKKVAYPIYIYDRATNVLKHVLFYNPVFFGGNIVVNTLKAGGNPFDVLKYAKEISNKGPLYREGLKMGIFSTAVHQKTNHVEHLISMAIREAEMKGGVWPKLIETLKHPAKTFRTAHQKLLWEHIYKGSCLALYEKGKKWGMPEAQAASHVHTFLGNFAKLTPFEKEVAQRVFFVYPWWRRNLPLQFKLWLTTPQKQLAFWKTYNVINKLAVGHGMEENPPTKRRHIATSFKDKRGNRIYLKPVLPDKDPIDFLVDVGGFFTRRLNPLGVEGLQQAFNKDLFTGKKIARYGISGELFGRTVPGGEVGARAVHAAKHLFWPLRTLEKGAEQALLREGTGSSVSTYSPYGQVFDLQRIIKEYTSEMGKAAREEKPKRVEDLQKSFQKFLLDQQESQ